MWLKVVFRRLLSAISEKEERLKIYLKWQSQEYIAGLVLENESVQVNLLTV